MDSIQEATRILCAFQQNPHDDASILGVKKEATRSAIYASFGSLIQALKPMPHLSLEEQATLIQAIKIVTRAKDHLLSEIMEKNAKTPKRKFFFIFTLIALVFIWAYLFYSIHSQITLLNFFASLGIGYFLADFASGFLHVLLDKFIAFTNPLLGEMAQDFEWHHEDPSTIRQKNFKALVEPILVFGVLPFSLLTLLLQGHPWAVLIIFFICGFNIFSQVIHKWSHLPSAPNRIIQFLQQSHLILPPQEHAQHHLFDAQKNFCLLTGHFNPFFNFVMKKLDRFTLKKKF